MPRYSRRSRYARQPMRGTRRSGCNGRLLLALGLALFAILSYCGTRSENPVTGEAQYVDLSPDQEIAMGLEAAPRMAREYGGLHPDQRAQALVDRVGERIVRLSPAAQSPYRYEFHLLADAETVNAFALPGGQVFITAALYGRLQSEGELAGALGHEIGHVVGRHSAERLAKSKLTQGLTGAAVLATAEGGRNSAAMAVMIGQMVNMKYGRDDELESDRFGVWFMSDAGYDPRSLIQLMKILDESSSGARPAEFFSTHPSPDNRIDKIQLAIRERFPDGVPADLEP